MTDTSIFKIQWHEQLNSTNIFLKRELLENSFEEFYVVCAKSQVKGKGQGNNKWESEDYKNLTFSLLLKPTFIEIQDQFIISKAISLAIIDVLNRYKKGFCIKWPNDIYYKNSKIAGILIENSLIQNKIGTSIIGIGININQTKFISDAPNPISLAQITNNEFNINEILNEILISISQQYQRIRYKEQANIDIEYFNALFQNNGIFNFKDKGGLFKASIKGISPYGHLILLTPDNEERSYAFKEVEFIL